MGRAITNHESVRLADINSIIQLSFEKCNFHTPLIDRPVLIWSIGKNHSDTSDRNTLSEKFLEINALLTMITDSNNPCLILWTPLSSSYFHFKIPAKSNNRETVLNLCKIHILRDERVVWIFRSIVRQVCPEDREWTPVELSSLRSVVHVDEGRILKCLCNGLLNDKL